MCGAYDYAQTKHTELEVKTNRTSLGVSILPLSAIFLLDFGIVQRM